MVKKIFIIFILMFMFIGIFSLTSFANDYGHNHDFQNGFCTICGKRHACNFVGATSSKPGVCFCGYSEADYVLQKKDTNLDLWIYEEVGNGDELNKNIIDNFYFIDTTGGYDLYMPKRYEEVFIDTQGNAVMPGPFVQYYIHSSTNKRVECILIKDPNIYIDEISLNSSLEEFKLWAVRNGLMVRYENDEHVSATSGHYTVSFSKNKMQIGYHEEYYATENELIISGPCCDNERHIDFTNWIIPCVVVVFSVLLYVWYCIKKNNHSDKID